MPLDSRRRGRTLGSVDRRTPRGRALVVVVATSLRFAASAAGQTCAIYETEFDAFAGPPAYSNGPFSLSWCLSGASVTGSNFCPTGNALKLDASAEDPLLLVRTGDAGCASITLSFTYAQFAPTGTVLKVGPTSAASASCAIATPTTLFALSTTGGTCVAVTVTVPLDGAQGLAFRFDHGANTNAIVIDSLVVSVTGCCGATHGCCEVGPPGCSDSAVAACVCAIDAYCCTTAWDDLCIAEVDSLGCGTCGPPPPVCLNGFATDFGTLYQTQSICLLRPDLFEFCEGIPPTLTISGACASTADPALRFGTGFPNSAAITRCIDLSSIDAPRLRFRYARNAGTIGPRIDWRSEGTDWAVAWQPTGTAGIGVCAEVALDLGPIRDLPGVRFRFTSASSIANGAVFDDLAIESAPPACGSPATGGCHLPSGTPACADAICCTAVCAVDPFCCDVAWDETCAAEAGILCAGDACGEGLGSCGLPRKSPGCDQSTCCGSVCPLDPFCCLVAWDEFCVASAMDLCSFPSGPSGPTGDLDGDGRVAASDLAMLLAAWGLKGSLADLDGDGVVGAADLAILLAGWTG